METQLDKTPTFKPSQVCLTGRPLCGTMESFEIESAVALIVRCCVVNGDKWQEVSYEMCRKTISDDISGENENPLKELLDNPFYKPDMYAALDSKYLEWVDNKSDLRITEKAFKAMERFVNTVPTKPYVEGELP